MNNTYELRVIVTSGQRQGSESDVFALLHGNANPTFILTTTHLNWGQVISGHLLPMLVGDNSEDSNGPTPSTDFMYYMETDYRWIHGLSTTPEGAHTIYFVAHVLPEDLQRLHCIASSSILCRCWTKSELDNTELTIEPLDRKAVIDALEWTLERINRYARHTSASHQKTAPNYCINDSVHTAAAA